METTLNEKVQIRALTMLARINFIAWSTFAIGLIVVLGLVALYFIFPGFYDYDPKSPNLQTQWVMIGFVGLIVAVIGFWMVRKTKNLRKSTHNLDGIDKKLMLLTGAALVACALIALPFLISAALIGPGGPFLFGVALMFVFLALLVDIIKFRSLVWRTKNNPQEIVENSKSTFRKIRILIYPKIKHNKIWHRAVTAIGWVVSIFSYFILFPIYFGVVQRIIYFVAYGDKKEEWLVKE